MSLLLFSILSFTTLELCPLIIFNFTIYYFDYFLNFAIYYTGVMSFDYFLNFAIYYTRVMSL